MLAAWLATDGKHPARGEQLSAGGLSWAKMRGGRNRMRNADTERAPKEGKRICDGKPMAKRTSAKIRGNYPNSCNVGLGGIHKSMVKGRPHKTRPRALHTTLAYDGQYYPWHSKFRIHLRKPHMRSRAKAAPTNHGESGTSMAMERHWPPTTKQSHISERGPRCMIPLPLGNAGHC